LDKTDILLAAIKFLGIIAAAAFAVLGIGHDFKTRAGKLTKWGYVAIWGVIGSTLLSTGSQVLEVLKARKDAAKSLELIGSVSQTLAEVKRSLEPVDLDKITFTFGLFFSIDDQAFAAYRPRLEAAYRNIKAELDKSGRKLLARHAEGLQILRVQEDAKASPHDILTIYPGSILWPDPASPREAIAAAILDECGLIIEFNRSSDRDSRDELDMTVAGRLDGRHIRDTVAFDRAEMLYDTKRRQVSIHVTSAPNITPDSVAFNTPFLSVVDFDQSAVTVEPTLSLKEGLDLAPSESLADFAVAFGPNRRLIAGRTISKGTSDGYTRFSFQLVQRWYDESKR
jgi:hypothetical protein